MVHLEGALGLTFWVVSIVNDIANVEIPNIWAVNNELCFDGIIKTVCGQDVSKGWHIYLQSSQTISTLNSSHASIHQSEENSSSFILTNLPWNGQCQMGETLQISFVGCTPERNTTPQMTVEFHRTQHLCPQIAPPRHRLVIQVPTVYIQDNDPVFKARLSITLPVTVQGNWVIYLAVSTRLSKLNAAGVFISPSHGDTFTLTNENWQQVLVAGKTYVLAVEGTKALHGIIEEPCITVVFVWDKHMEVLPSTTPIPSPSRTTSHTVLEKVQPTSKESSHQTMSSLVISTTITPTVKSSTARFVQTTKNWQPTASVTTSTPQSCAPYDYNEVLHKSILFYEAQRSGKLPSNNRIEWRGHSALGDKGENGEDLTGGWYDAGDYVKFGFPMAFSTTLLTWGLIEFPQSYMASGEVENMLSSIKWPLDYFIKAHVSPKEFYGQVGDGDIDHAYWGRPEDMTMSRPAFKIDSSKPGSDLAAETAAAMAAGSIAFADRNQTYAKLLLANAKTLYEFADNYRGRYSDSITDAAQFYKSSDYYDELTWGAAWLYRATKNESYLQKAETYFTRYDIGKPAWGFSWDEKIAGVQLLLYQLTSKDAYKTAIQNSLDEWLPGGSVTYTPKGLAWRLKWGANRYAANTAFLALLASVKGLKSTEYREFGEKQIHYMLGDSGRSFVVGFGTNPPTRPHHASSSCPDRPAACGWEEFHSPDANPQILYGALVGGPDQNDGYQDKRDDYISNEVACDYNAAFQSAVAALKAADLGSCSYVALPTSARYSSLSMSTLRTNETPVMTSKELSPVTHGTSAAISRETILSTVQMTSASISLVEMKFSASAVNTHSSIPSLSHGDVTVSSSHSQTASSQVSIIMVTEVFKPSPSTLRYPSTSALQVPSPSPSDMGRTSVSSIQVPSPSPSPSDMERTSISSIQVPSPSPSDMGRTSISSIQVPSPSPSPSDMERTSISSIQVPSPSPSDMGRTSPSPAKSTNTEKLRSMTTLKTTHSSAQQTSVQEIHSSPTVNVLPSSTTTTQVGETILPHECGDVSVPSGYSYLEASVSVLSDWAQGFTGKIKFTATDDVRDGWQVELLMSKPVSSLSVHVVTTTSSSGSRFTLKNKDYNKQLDAGSTTSIGFEATKATENENVPCIRAVFLWAVESFCPKLDSTGSNSVPANATITSQWNDGISGDITMVIPEQIQSGWQMQVLFDEPLTLTVYDATITSPPTGTQFTMMNKSYNKELQSGTSLVITFTAIKQDPGSTVLCIDALFLW